MSEVNPAKIGELAADIYELIQERDVLLAEGAMALVIAFDWQTTNCGCTGCNCGDLARERAKKEMRGTAGAAAGELFHSILDARDKAAFAAFKAQYPDPPKSTAEIVAFPRRDEPPAGPEAPS